MTVLDGRSLALDICACGHERQQHPDDGPCSQLHEPHACPAFRLSATAEDITEGYAEWRSGRDEEVACPLCHDPDCEMDCDGDYDDAERYQ